ncbi:MAG: hypothetical protein C5B54_05260 [Acidobacteria bacterium]|nr:MAG: hypothetical protein C5B54_05260 [Acidobacteriota bacterium]
MKGKQSGFSLVELMIVIAIIGLICAIIIPNLIDARERARQRATVGEMHTWSTALAEFYVDKSLYPDPAGGMAVVYSQLVPHAVETLHLNDAWDFPFVYDSDSANNFQDYTLRSTGNNGVVDPGITPGTWFYFFLDIILTDGTFVNAPS